MFVLARNLSYRESTKKSKERQGATVSVNFSEEFVLQRVN